MAKINIAEFEFDVTAIEKAVEETERLKKSTFSLRQEQKELNDATKRAGSVTDYQAKKLAELDQKIKANNTAYRENTKVIQASYSSLENVNKLLNEEIKTELQASASIKKLTQARKGLDQSTISGKKQLELLNAKIDENNKFLDQSSDKYTAQKRNIGNYGDAVGGLSPTLNKYIVGLRKTQTGLKAYKTALASATTSTNIFKVALISTGIGAIVVAIGLLITAFMNTQRGVDSVTRVLTPLKVLFQSIIGVVEKVSFAMVDAFKNPEQAVKDLWEVIKTNLVNRVTALGGVFKALGKIISSGFTDGYKDLANSTLQIATGVENVIDKVDSSIKKTAEFTREALSRGKKIAELNIETSKLESEIALKRSKNLDLIKQQELISKDKSKSDAERVKAVERAKQLTQDNLSLENEILAKKVERVKLENESNDTSRAGLQELNELEAQLEQNKTKARATDLRFLGVKNQLEATAHKERVARQKELVAEAKRLAQEKVADLGIELEMYKEQNSLKFENDKKLNDDFITAKTIYLQHVRDLEKTSLDYKLEQGLIKQNEYNLAVLESENEFQTAKRELELQYEEQKKAEDLQKLQEEKEARQIEFELQLEENSLRRQTEYERKIEDEALQYENDLAILDENRISEELTDEVYRRKKEVLTQKHNDKLKEIELRKKKFDDDLRNQKLNAEINQSKQMLNLIQTLAGEGSKVAKAMALAQATMSAYQSVVNTFKTASESPLGIANPAYPYIQAGLAGAFGAVQVAKVAGVKFEKGGYLQGNSHANGGINIEAEGGEAIVNKTSMSNPFFRNIVSAINVAGGGVDFSTVNRTGYFEDGGMVSRALENVPENQTQTIKVVNDVTETFDVYDNNVVQVQNLTSN